MTALLMAKCLGTEMKQTVKVLVPQLKFDSFFNMYFRETEQLLVHDLNQECKAGDWLLIRQLDQRLSLRVNHKVERIIYSAGHVVDPLTGRQSLGYEYASEADRHSALFQLKPPLQRRHKTDG